MITSKRVICVGGSKEPFPAPSPGDLTGRSYRGREAVWSPGTFCRGAGGPLRLYFPVSESLTLAWLPGVLRPPRCTALRGVNQP